MTQTSPTSATQQLQGFAEFVHTTMQDWQLPGLAIAIVKDGEVTLAQGFGKRNVAQDLDVTPNTLFAIASCTKAFTATALGILVDEGKLEWDKPVRNYLPSFKMHDTFASERMTARDLLTHRSGLPRHDLMWYNSSRSRPELFERLQYLEPSQDFRSQWQYQNLMYMTAGYLLEKISGQSWADFVKQRILDPLDMTASNFSIADSKNVPDFALPYREEQDEVQETNFYERQQAIGPAGAINSSVVDMSKWLLLQLNKGKYDEQQIISESQLAQIHTPQIVVPQPRKHKELSHASYALGWGVESYRGHTLIQHSGGIDGFSSLTTFLPDDNIGIVVLTNKSSCPVHTVVTYNACDRLLGLDEIGWNERIHKEHQEVMEVIKKSMEPHLEDRVPDTQPSHPLAAYTGEFEHPAYDTVSIKQDGEQLTLTLNELTMPMTHYHYDLFQATLKRFFFNSKVSFATSLKGEIESLSIALEPAVKEITFKRATDQSMRKKSFLEPFVGEYEVMGIVATVTLRGEKALFLTVPGQPDYELFPYQGTTFQIKDHANFSVEFKRDEAGNVTEAVITQPQGTMAAKKKQQS
jgi:CubicO group peptidase (beta-lactamase class C family)